MEIGRVQEVPNKFTSVMRDEIVRSWKAQYYKKSQNNAGYTLSDAERLNNASHQWQDAEMFEIVLMLTKPLKILHTKKCFTNCTSIL